MTERTEKKKIYVRRKCLDYLRKAKSIPGARDLGRLDGFDVGMNVWLGAMGELIEEEKVKRLNRIGKLIDR